MAPVNYRDAGVDIDAGTQTVKLFADAVKSTHGPEVLASIGAFGGLFEASGLATMNSPVLVASTDGVGTKTEIAASLQRYDSIGHDIVNHCVNDILVQGARPLFFLDYVAAAKLKPERVAEIVGGMAQACARVGCALLGGETAEMPGVYRDNSLDIVGTIVGVVEKNVIVDGSKICQGDAVIAIASTGLHTNGYSLARRVFANDDLNEWNTELQASLGETLLQPHRCYLPYVQKVMRANIPIHGMAHITGGGLLDNPPRIMPAGTALRLRRSSWRQAPIFDLMQRRADIGDDEMARVFNCGVGWLLYLDANDREACLKLLGADAWHVGDVVTEDDGARVHFV